MSLELSRGSAVTHFQSHCSTATCPIQVWKIFICSEFSGYHICGYTVMCTILITISPGPRPMMSFRMCSRTFTTTPRLPSYHSNTLSFYMKTSIMCQVLKAVMSCHVAIHSCTTSSLVGWYWVVKLC